MKLPRCEQPEALGSGVQPGSEKGVTHWNPALSLLGTQSAGSGHAWGRPGDSRDSPHTACSQAPQAQGRVILGPPLSAGPEVFPLVIQQTCIECLRGAGSHIPAGLE